MAFTYSGDPSTSSRDQVRFLLGDTDGSSPLLQDAEIDWLLTQEHHIFLAAARAADTIAAKFTSEVNVSADGMSFNAKDIGDNYAKLAERLRATHKATQRYGIPYVGGILVSEHGHTDHDVVPHSFTSHMHDNPGGGHDEEIRPKQ